MNVRGLWGRAMLATIVAPLHSSISGEFLLPDITMFAANVSRRSIANSFFVCNWICWATHKLLVSSFDEAEIYKRFRFSRMLWFTCREEWFDCRGKNKGEANCDIDSKLKISRDAIFLNWRKWLRQRKSKRNLIAYTVRVREKLPLNFNTILSENGACQMIEVGCQMSNTRIPKQSTLQFGRT